MSTLNFLVIGDSEAGKSSFIKNFTTNELANLLDISGRGQTTRCNGIYEFSNNYSVNKVEVKFYTKTEFIDRIFDKIIQKRELIPKQKEFESYEQEISIKDIEFKTDYTQWYEENRESLSDLCESDFISDEFINLEELKIDRSSAYIEKNDFENIVDYDGFQNLVKEKIAYIYKIAKAKINQFVTEYGVLNTEENEVDSEDIKNLNFELNAESKFLFALCIKQIKNKKIREENNCELISISGLVKNTKVSMKLNPLYEKVCTCVGIDKIAFVDTYGLDHESNEEGSIEISKIKDRLKTILNYEYKEIESVIFITPMLGKAAGTNGRFKAVLEAKRSVFPQIVYTKFDSYLEEELEQNISELSENDLQELTAEYQKCNKNYIDDSFYKILEDYYSSDVANYRKRIILDNIAYFMGAYEKNVDSISAQRINLIYLKKIIMNIFQKNNMGIGNKTVTTSGLTNELQKSLIDQKNLLDSYFSSMLSSAQNVLAKNYNNAHGNTKTAFWKRIRSNMFGFNNNLDLRRILIEQFDNLLAKDAGERKDNNLGNVIINKYFIENELNIFIRECINDFSRYFFCTGCMPCDNLSIGNCEISSLCNNTGRPEGRKNRKDSCYQFNRGMNIGSQEASRYCNNTNICGIGIYDDNYGNEHDCNKNCYWKNFFVYFENADKQKISLNCNVSIDFFINVFTDFCVKKYEQAKDNLDNIKYIESIEIEVCYGDEKNINLDYEMLLEVPYETIVITEGKTDKMHIESAWKKLRKQDFPCFICDVGGADNIPSFLKSYPADLLKGKIIIGVFDYDNKGIKLFNSIKTSKEKNDYYKEIKEGDKHYYAIILPHMDKSIEHYEAGEIELLYRKDLLNSKNVLRKRNINAINNIEYVKTNQLFINSDDYQNIEELKYFEPLDNKKTYFAEYIRDDLSELENEDFLGFQPLFELFDKILGGKK